MKFDYILTAMFLVLFSSLAGASGEHPGGHGNSSIGKPGKAVNVTRTVTISMYDSMRYKPAHISVKQGETIRFRVLNSGKIKHELVLGNEKDLMEHYEIMKKNPEMEHDDENMITLQPGASGEIIWQFTKAGKVDFACLLPGHYEAGMKGIVSVKSKQTKRNNK
jgi:uncharacterized cupredoxin-like copper-binding protein